MTKASRIARRGQEAPARASIEPTERARILADIARLPSSVRAVLTRAKITSAALSAVALALSLDVGSPAWIATSLVAAYPWAVARLLALGASQEDAIDIAQSSIGTALMRIETFDPSLTLDAEPLRPWLFGILRNTFLDRRRWRRTRREVPLGMAPWQDISVPGHAAQVEASDMLRALRDRVDPDDWRAWCAHALEGETTAEIGARTHEPTSVIEARFRRVHVKLDRLLRPFGVQRKTRRRKGGA